MAAGRRGQKKHQAADDRRPPPTEAELARLWASGALADGASAEDGTPVQVLYPGRPGGRAGPDFRGAVLRLGDEQPVVGNVELHRAAGGFAQHGHATDPAYDGIALHAVFDAGGAQQTALSSGRTVPVVQVDGSAEPGMPLREPCATAVERLGEAAVDAVLLGAARWRLARKAEGIGLQIVRVGTAQALYVAMATALGQKDNARAFTLLAERAPVAGLLAEGLEPGDARAAQVERALLHAAGLDGALLAPGPALPWNLAGRPAAHPARRIRALAVIVDRLARPSLSETAEALVATALTGDAPALLAAFVVRGAQPPAACGRGRSVEILINALLPWAAIRAGATDQRDAIIELAALLPAAEAYGAISHLARNLRLGSGRPLLRSPLHQQGALAMLAEWCQRGGCGRCPLS